MELMMIMIFEMTIILITAIMVKRSRERKIPGIAATIYLIFALIAAAGAILSGSYSMQVMNILFATSFLLILGALTMIVIAAIKKIKG